MEASLETLERSRHQVAQARQEIDAHAGMEAVAVDAANGEEANLRAVAEGYQGSGSDVLRIVPEQELTLRVADSAAARTGAIEKRPERLERFVVFPDDAEESPGLDVLKCIRRTEEYEYGVIGTKSGAHRLFDGRNGFVQVRRGEQL